MTPEQQQWLDADEQARLARLRRPHSQQCFLASRLLMRHILAEALDTHPAQVPLQREQSGKPFVAGATLAFNLSHSGPWLALALAPEGSLGVDIEVPQKPRPLLSIAQQYFHPQEVEHLQQLPEAAQTQVFYRYWTLKEAYFKARGTGISAGLGKLHLAADKPQILARDPALGDSHSWQLHYWHNPLGLDPRCHLALVADSGAGQVELVSLLASNCSSSQPLSSPRPPPRKRRGGDKN